MLTSASKKALSSTIRRLRDDLLESLAAEANRRYRRTVSAADAQLDAGPAALRRRLDGWLDEHTRAAAPKNPAAAKATRERLFAEAVESVASTFLNRLVVLKTLEAHKMLRPALVTGGLNSPGARAFREYAPALFDDENEGYTFLLGEAFDEVALDLPGLFGEVGLSTLFVVPADMVRATIEALNHPDLDEAWHDDTTLGWVYQYWNDPRREALDEKIKSGGKLEAHEIAPKTQMFTERYMVEWLLQNTLGLQWLALCQKHGWTPDCVAQGTLDDLEARRVDWRGRRERGEVAAEDEMPTTPGGLEARWRYYVPQGVPAAMVGAIPGSVREWKVLDPACGSGHFLVIAFGLLTALYEEEARHRGETWTPKDIAERIVEHNLHGIDLDARAVQIAAAALMLAVRRYAPDAAPKRMQLVATAFDLGRLQETDPSLVHLLNALWEDGKVPPAAVKAIVKALRGIDALGTLLKVDRTLEDALKEAEREGNPTQGRLLGDDGGVQVTQATARTQVDLVGVLEALLARETRQDDLGLRLDGEQLAAGVRFARMVREGQYDLVVGNPPYQGTAKMADAGYVTKHYPMGKADLYAAFLQRGLDLVKSQGLNAMVTMRGWMFLGQYQAIREWQLDQHQVRLILDLDSGAFEEVSAAQVVLSVSCTVVRKAKEATVSSSLRPTPISDRASTGMTDRKRSGLLAQVGRYNFDPASFGVIEGKPLVYWWGQELLELYSKSSVLGHSSPGRAAQSLGNNARYSRVWWEVGVKDVNKATKVFDRMNSAWSSFVNGSESLQWIEPLREIVNWRTDGLEIKLGKSVQTNRDAFLMASENYWGVSGIAFSMIGANFSARKHRYPGVLGDMGSSLYPEQQAETLCMMNTRLARQILESLNPTVHFQVGDVNRLPLFPVESADEIVATLDRAFTEHEAARETSVEFRRPGPSPWRAAQAWAQVAVDRPAGAPLPPYAPEYDPPTPLDFVSFAFGVCLGRFAADGSGLLDRAPDTALPGGILLVHTAGGKDTLDTPAAAPLLAAWNDHGPALAPGVELREWLTRSFFALHKDRYDNRPIWWPLSSAKKTFVAWVAIHRMSARTLPELLSDHLVPLKRTLEGIRDDLQADRESANKKTRTEAQRRHAELTKQLDELGAFVALVEACADRGPPEGVGGKRERDAVYDPVLDDGVMVNASALYPLLDAQWKDPRKWWGELSSPEKRKDYDWSQLARRYFPARVEAKCVNDPSLAVAHGCFWRLHPARAYAWELRLQHDLRPGFVIDEADAEARRAAFLRDAPEAAREIEAKERKRRERKAAKEDEAAELPLGDEGEGAEASA